MKGQISHSGRIQNRDRVRRTISLVLVRYIIGAKSKTQSEGKSGGHVIPAG